MFNHLVHMGLASAGLRAMMLSIVPVVALLMIAPSAADATGSAKRLCGEPRGFHFGTSGFADLEMIGLTTDQRLICFEEDSPAFSRSIGQISNLVGDTKIVGIDFRPATGDLYGLGNAGGVYILSLQNASATFKSQLNTALTGTFFGVDFNPTVDLLRVISDTGQNLAVNVDTGAVTVGTALNPAPGTGVTGAAYTNNDSDPDTATTLFDVDSLSDRVSIQAPPAAGTLNPTGKLFADTTADVGFDIYTTVRGGRAVGNEAYASLNTGGKARLYRINLLTGKAIFQGNFSAKNQLVGLAIPLSQR